MYFAFVVEPINTITWNDLTKNAILCQIRNYHDPPHRYTTNATICMHMVRLIFNAPTNFKATSSSTGSVYLISPLYYFTWFILAYRYKLNYSLCILLFELHTYGSGSPLMRSVSQFFHWLKYEILKSNINRETNVLVIKFVFHSNFTRLVRMYLIYLHIFSHWCISKQIRNMAEVQIFQVQNHL